MPYLTTSVLTNGPPNPPAPPPRYRPIYTEFPAIVCLFALRLTLLLVYILLIYQFSSILCRFISLKQISSTCNAVIFYYRQCVRTSRQYSSSYKLKKGNTGSCRVSLVRVGGGRVCVVGRKDRLISGTSCRCPEFHFNTFTQTRDDLLLELLLHVPSFL